MQTIAERLEDAQKTIEKVAKAAGREPHSVQLLAVSKTKPVSDISQAYEVGQRKFGENYVQEALEKIESLKHLKDIEWHLIGPLQSNKTRDVASAFDWVQSIDREKIAKRLNDQRPPNMDRLNVCIQVNIDSEESKAGIAISQLDDFVDYINRLPNLKLRGLMAIPKALNDAKAQQKSFSELEQAFMKYHTLNQDFDTLSLGMSNDLNAAIIAGSTMVRLGTAIFGART